MPKSDGLAWLWEDLLSDGVHPESSGRQKVAEMLLDFFSTDPLTSTWFVPSGE
jgi:lysophospholipase L1-like esterase